SNATRRSEPREPTPCDKVSLGSERVRREPRFLVLKDRGHGPSAAPLHDDHITTARAPIEFHDTGAAEVLDLGMIAPGVHGALGDWTGHGGGLDPIHFARPQEAFVDAPPRIGLLRWVLELGGSFPTSVRRGVGTQGFEPYPWKVRKSAGFSRGVPRRGPTV